MVWGKIRLWLRDQDSVPLRQEYFSEHGELLKIMDGTNIKTFGKHNVPVDSTMTVPQKPGNKTTMHFDDIVFDQPIVDEVFTQENLRKAGAK